uniref:Uncharacterized protein n=2 Tax=Anguilla anguilla TaxID=7936 RepID=A0A0E9SHA8_ANGAN
MKLLMTRVGLCTVVYMGGGCFSCQLQSFRYNGD